MRYIIVGKQSSLYSGLEMTTNLELEMSFMIQIMATYEGHHVSVEI